MQLNLTVERGCATVVMTGIDSTGQSHYTGYQMARCRRDHRSCQDDFMLRLCFEYRENGGFSTCAGECRRDARCSDMPLGSFLERHGLKCRLWWSLIHLPFAKGTLNLKVTLEVINYILCFFWLWMGILNKSYGKLSARCSVLAVITSWPICVIAQLLIFTVFWHCYLTIATKKKPKIKVLMQIRNVSFMEVRPY